jgi:hypothetical protein
MELVKGTLATKLAQPLHEKKYREVRSFCFRMKSIISALYETTCLCHNCLTLHILQIFAITGQ